MVVILVKMYVHGTDSLNPIKPKTSNREHISVKAGRSGKKLPTHFGTKLPKAAQYEEQASMGFSATCPLQESRTISLSLLQQPVEFYNSPD